MDVITVQKCKRPQGTGTWAAYVIDTDAFGTWVFTPAHSIFSSQDGATTGSCEVARDSEGRGRHSLLLLPARGWFVAYWVLDADHVVSVDISTPPQSFGSWWRFEDLELDPFLTRDGAFGVEDEDEFETACDAELITSAERTAALDAVTWLEAQLTDPGSAFIEAGQRRLLDAIRLELPPLPMVDSTRTP